MPSKLDISQIRELSLEELDDPAQAVMLDNWLAAKGPAEVPSYSSFNVLACPETVPNLVVIERSSSGFVDHVRFSGGSPASLPSVRSRA